jgi:twitching motility two-component system response regulator PilG
MKVFKELNLATESPFVTNATVSTDPHADWVLVVDDTFAVREYMREKLRPLNYNVDYADTGEQAIGLSGQKHYTCVFLDVLLPGVGGYQVCKLIKSSKSAEKTTIIMLNDNFSIFDKIRGILSGSDAYLVKPIKDEILLEIMAKYLPARS